MKSFDIRVKTSSIKTSFIKTSFLANSPLYSLLAVFIPLTILVSLLLFIEAIFSLPLPLFLLTAFSVLTAAAASLYSDFMKDAKSSLVAANIRGIIILLIISYVVSSFFNPVFSFRSGSIQVLFGINRYNIPASACVIYMWLSVNSLKQLFSERKRFETYTEMYMGDALKNVISEDTSLLVFTHEKLMKTKHSYTIQLCIITIITFLCTIYNVIMPTTLYILLLIIFIGAVCITGFFGTITWEIYFAGEGVSLSAPDRTKRILAMIAFSFVCLLAAIILASNESILPFSIIAGFFIWLFSRIRFPEQSEPLRYEEVSLGMGEMEQGGIPFDQGEPVSELWKKIMEVFWSVIKYGVIILVIGCFIWFMISPLLNRGKYSGKMTFMQKLVRIITEWFRGTISAIAAFFAGLREGKSSKKRRKYSSEEIHRAAASLFSVYSPIKKREIRRSVTLFAKLILWGEDVRKVTWQPSHAPGEYCNILTAAVPQGNEAALRLLNADIIRIGELFGKALYSAEVLTVAEQKEFKNLVEGVILS